MQPSCSPSDLIRAAYSANLFERLAEVWQQKLTEHLRDTTAGRGRVLNWSDPDELVTAAEKFLQGTPVSDEVAATARFACLLDSALQNSQNLHHPRYIGHQVPASLPPAALFDAAGTVTNQPMAIYEMGPWATAVEHAVLRALRRKVGWPDDAPAGLLTSGGSLANLTALLTARNVAFPNCWERGMPGNAALVTHAESHYCVTRAAGILGLGTHQVIRVPVNAERQMDVCRLEDILQQQTAAGKKVIAVCAAACATPVGAFDALSDIAEVCRRFETWLHVDAAHGGAALMSKQHRGLLKGIDQADSVVWDAHKMMFVPALCAAVLYRNPDHRFETFRQDAPYLFDPSDPGMATWDSGMTTIECTKRPLGFGVWSVWSVFGETLFEQIVDHTFSVAAHFFERLAESTDFETLHKPQCNIIAFRYLPEQARRLPAQQQDALQHAIRHKLTRSGTFYITQTRLDGRTALRATVMNPLTTSDDVAALIDSIRAAAAAQLSQ